METIAAKCEIFYILYSIFSSSSSVFEHTPSAMIPVGLMVGGALASVLNAAQHTTVMSET
jgi:hypothetical protein